MKPLTPTTPHVIIMTGIPGAGKSAFAERFAKTFQAPIISQQTIAEAGDLDDTQSAAVTSVMLDELMKTQRTVIYEGATSTKTSRNDISKKVTAAGYKPLLVWVQTESVEAKRRATRRQTGGARMTSDEFDTAIKKFHAPSLNEKAVVISGKHTYATQLKIILRHLAGQQRPEPPRSTPPVRSPRTVILR